MNVMKIDHALPVTVREIEHLEIPMPDGTNLAARIWMPDGAAVPAILEYIPYRKNDKTLERNHARAPWIAAQGYAYVRVDLRGTGESEGVMTDEYTEIELRDGCDVFAWIADQAWCDGGVGIVGISWAFVRATAGAPEADWEPFVRSRTLDRGCEVAQPWGRNLARLHMNYTRLCSKLRN